MSVSNPDRYDRSSEKDPVPDRLTVEQIRGVWDRVIKASGRPAEKFKAILPEILALAAGEKEKPEDTGRHDGKSSVKEYNVYDDISQSIYGYDSSDTVESSPYPGPDQDRSISHGYLSPDEDKATGTNTQSPHSGSNSNTEVQLPNLESPDLDQFIAKLIYKQLEQSAICNTLARNAPTRRAQRLLSLISNRDYSAARSLASMLSDSGNLRLNGMGSPQTAAYYRSAIRDAWKNETSLTAECASVSEKTEDVPLIQTLLNAARWHAENAVELKRLIEQRLDFG